MLSHDCDASWRQSDERQCDGSCRFPDVRTLFSRSRTRSSFGCKGNGMSAYFIQKESASIGHFETANFVREGSCESTTSHIQRVRFPIARRGMAARFVLTEDLAPGAALVNGRCNQLLAGACLLRERTPWHLSVPLVSHRSEHRFESGAIYDLLHSYRCL